MYHANKSSRRAEKKLKESPWNQSGRIGSGLRRKGFAEKPTSKGENERLNELEKMQVVIVKMVKKMMMNCHV